MKDNPAPVAPTRCPPKPQHSPHPSLMSSESENPSAPGTPGRPALRRRSGRGRTFRPRHRLSKPKLETAEDSTSTSTPAAVSAAPPAKYEARRDTEAVSEDIPASTLPVDVADQVALSSQPELETETESEAEAGAGQREDQPREPFVTRQPRERPLRPPAPVSAAAARAAAPPMLPGSVEALSYRPASPRSVEQAVLEVKRIVDGLVQALQDMEEVLELIEDAEQQKVADEREIERLQEMLRQVTQVRDRLPSLPPSGERGRPERPEPASSQRAGHGSGSGHAPGQGQEQAHGHGGGEDRLGGGRRRRRGRGRGRGRDSEGTDSPNRAPAGTRGGENAGSRQDQGFTGETESAEGGRPRGETSRRSNAEDSGATPSAPGESVGDGSASQAEA